MSPDILHRTPLIDSHAHVYTTDMPLSYAVLAAASLFDDYNEYSLEATRKHKHLRITVDRHEDVVASC